MPQPPLTGQDIGRAHFATRALLELQLDGLPFPAWTALNLIGRSSALPAGELVSALVEGLKIDRPAATEVIGALTARGLVQAGPNGVVEPTAAGRKVFERVTAGIGRIVDVLYGDIPEADLVVARRVLELVRARADAELARIG